MKQKKYVDVLIKTGNKTEAAMQAYKPKNRKVASVI
jgi:phage terminase small subunit